MDAEYLMALQKLLDNRLGPISEQLQHLNQSMNENRTELKLVSQRMESLEDQRVRQDRINRRMGREIGDASREIAQITEALKPLLDSYNKVRPWSTVGARVAALVLFVGTIAATTLIQTEVRNARTDRPAILAQPAQSHKTTADSGRSEGGGEGGDD